MALVEIDSPYHEYENAADRDGFDELYYLDGMEQTLVRNAYKLLKIFISCRFEAKRLV